MTGREAIHCPGCNRVIAYISEIAAKQAVRGTAFGMLPFSVIESRIGDAAALCCCDCEAARIVAAVPLPQP